MIAFGIVMLLLAVVLLIRDTATGETIAPDKLKYSLHYICPTATQLYDGAGMDVAHRLMGTTGVEREVLDKFLDFYANERKPTQAKTSTSASTIPIAFAPGEPRTFEAYAGQASTLGLLKDAIGALRDTECRIAPQLFAGWAGSGKTLLAKVVANELNARNVRLGLPPARFMEYMPVSLATVESLDKMMREVQQNPGCVVFIDEIHAVAGKEHFLKFYQVLEENRYRFEGEAHPVALPPATYLAATTDYGVLADAFKRRWVIHFFQPSTPEQIKQYLQNRGARVYPVQDAAVDLIVERMHYSGAPWESLQIYQMAVNAAKAAGRAEVTPEDVLRVYSLHGVDALGLRHIDRQVLAAMFKLVKTKTNGEHHYAGSEDSVINMSRVDAGEFRSSVRPRLMSRGLLEIRPYWGHTLTERAEQVYGVLKDESNAA